MFELITDKKTPEAATYSGKVEICTFEFKTLPEELPGSTWFATTFINKVAGTLLGYNSKLLVLKVWRDTEPLFWQTYKVEATASASPLPWSVIIPLILVIIVLLITWKIISIIVDWWPVPPKPVSIALIIAVVALIGAIAYQKVRPREVKAKEA